MWLHEIEIPQVIIYLYGLIFVVSFSFVLEKKYANLDDRKVNIY